MFGKKEEAPRPAPSRPPAAPSPGSRTLIDSGMRIQGEVQGKGDFELRGSFDGALRVEGSVTIAQGGRLTGEVSAGDIVLSGAVEGQVSASRQLRLEAGGQLKGDIRAASLVIAEGAVVNGKVRMGAESEGVRHPAPEKRIAGLVS